MNDVIPAQETMPEAAEAIPFSRQVSGMKSGTLNLAAFTGPARPDFVASAWAETDDENNVTPGRWCNVGSGGSFSFFKADKLDKKG